MTRLPPVLLATVASLVLTPAALARERADSAGSTADGGAPGASVATTARAAEASTMALRLDGGLLDRGRRYTMRGQRLAVSGTVHPYTPGQTVSVDLLRGGRLVKRTTVAVSAAGGGGRFEASVTATSRGRHAVEAHLDAPAGSRLASAPAQRFDALYPRARRGARGLKVRLLQRGLRALAYVSPSSGRFDDATARAVLAFRKANGMRRNRVADRRVYGRLFRGRGGFRLKYPRAGRHVEFDKSRQVLVLAARGRAERIYHASSGKPSTPTVFGTFRFYRRQWGTNSSGMVHSIYFVRGYAIHGYKSVPARPASHGCIRIPIPDARSVARWIRLGDRIFVYR